MPDLPGRAPGGRAARRSMIPSDGREGGTVIRLGELVMILDFHRQGLSVSAIARRVGSTARRCANTSSAAWNRRAYGPRQPRARRLKPFEAYLRERVVAYPGLTGSRLLREIREHGYAGGYTAVTDFLREVRPSPMPAFEVRFETPPGEQAQVDFAHFQVIFTDEPGAERIVWLFSLVLGYSRLIWARFVAHQDLQTVLRCHIGGLRGVGRGAARDPLRPHEDRGDRRGRPGPHRLQPRADRLGGHYGFQPKACRPYRAKTKGKVERPFRYIREDFFLARSFRNLDDLNAQLAHWLGTVANPRRACDDAARRQRSLCRREARAPALAAGAVPRRAQARAAGLA